MPESTQSRSTKNHLLTALPDEDFERLLPDLEAVDLPHGQVLYKPDEPIKYVYFPENAMVSVVATTPDGGSAEVGVIGREGMTGIDVLMGVDSTPNESMVQLPDGGRRISTEAIKKEFKLGGALQSLLLRYINSLLTQVSQTALCNRLHSTEQRLARWLLMCHDRAESDQLPLTQDFLSLMLGVNRPSVTVTAVSLQGAEFIKYRRGKITILDREGLEDFCCDCYRITRREDVK
jgi:CRP-like cAMP-binding protein